MASQFKPTPPDADALRLRVVRTADQGERQFWIENGPGPLGGEFDEHYVCFSGFFGPHNPWVFAAAPELLEALEAARIALIAVADSAVEAGFDQLADIIDEQLGKANIAIARARGEQA